jgi:acid phosphatase type 7
MKHDTNNSNASRTLNRTLSASLNGFFLLIALGVGSARAVDAFDPPALYLQWQRDPATTMTIHWHTVDEAKSELFFRKPGETNWLSATGSAQPFLGTDRMVHVVELTGLAPATDYEFCFWPGERVFKFRTMPRDLSRPVRFVAGGDVYHEKPWMNAMNALAGKLDPAFVVIGGDLAYVHGGTNQEGITRWFDYFDSWKTNAVHRTDS